MTKSLFLLSRNWVEVALWAGSTNKNVGVEPPRRVQHEFVGVREVGISTTACGHLGDARPVQISSRVPSIRLCSSQDTPSMHSISFVYSELPGRVSIVNFKCRQEMQADLERLPFSRLLGEKRSDIKSAVCVLTCGKRPLVTTISCCLAIHVACSRSQELLVPAETILPQACCVRLHRGTSPWSM